MKTLAGSSWGFTTETQVATYKATMCPILNYATPIWFTQVSSHLDKLEVIQNKALRVATACHRKASASHLRAETGVLPLRAHLELCCLQFYASALQPLHPSPIRATLQALYHRTLRGLQVRGDDPNAPPSSSGACWKKGTNPLARRLLRGRMMEETIWSQAPN